MSRICLRISEFEKLKEIRLFTFLAGQVAKNVKRQEYFIGLQKS